ncbi:hypothetical protein COF01_27970 [Bacillus pseudomycoides]|uniref:hypothetical protein n=1 Tax=Bacillus pseudomycoides TaxID=64104 RepID=UPI00030A2EA9|nr:hypothetical protein [Bacillus pseudomycoides]PHC31171.1 hypothetical protein COF01_27970 [Bacillus pseudomycoides]
MKNLIFKELKLISFKEKKAKKIVFDSNITVLFSDNLNKTGKSTIVKSLYDTLGAEVRFHDSWKNLEVVNVLTFTIDNVEYTMVKEKNRYSLFNHQKNLIGSWDKVTEELAPEMAKLLGYKLTLPNRRSKEVIPPPAYFFLPFYIDQDKSWNQEWSSFENLSQFANWKDIVIQYHAGVLTDKYFEVSNQIMMDQAQKDINTKNYDSLQYALRRFENELKVSQTFNIESDDFKEEINSLIKELEQLQLVEDEWKAQLTDLYNDRLILKQRKKSIEQILNGSQVDYSKIYNKCKTCGSQHQDSFTARLKAAETEAKCHQLLNEIAIKLKRLDENIKEVNQIFTQKGKEKENLNNILISKRGALTIKEIISLEGSYQFKTKIQEDLYRELEKVNELEIKLANLRKQKKQIKSDTRKTEITTEYINCMTYFLEKLNVKNISLKSYNSLKSKIKEQGSHQPRALLAYYLSILKLIEKHSTSTLCPIVIDSPNQQDQSEENLNKMLNAIMNERPKNSQLILAVVERPNTEIQGSHIMINFNQEHRLLEEKEYNTVLKEVENILTDSSLSKL